MSDVDLPPPTFGQRLLRGALRLVEDWLRAVDEEASNRVVIDRREVLASALGFYADQRNWMPVPVPDEELPPEALSALVLHRSEDGWAVMMRSGPALDGGDHARLALQMTLSDLSVPASMARAQGQR